MTSHKTCRWLEDYKFELYVYQGCFLMHKANLSKSLTNLNKFRKQNLPESRTGEIVSMIEDIREILRALDSVQADFDRFKNAWTSERALEDSREAVRYADSVGRVTTLAFFFIPLSFVTSTFGMNVTQFGSGTAPIRLAVAIGVALVTALLVVGPLSPAVSKRLRHLQLVTQRNVP